MDAMLTDEKTTHGKRNKATYGTHEDESLLFWGQSLALS